MKSNKLKRVVNNSRNYGGTEAFNRIVNAYYSNLYQKVDAFKGWYCEECNEHDEYVIMCKNNQYVCIYYNHIEYDTKISIINENIETYINRLKAHISRFNR